MTFEATALSTNINQDRLGLGVGLGFREPLAAELSHHPTGVDFYELIGDALFDSKTLEFTLEATEGRPRVCHFLHASLATEAPLDSTYLTAIGRIMDATGALWL